MLTIIHKFLFLSSRKKKLIGKAGKGGFNPSGSPCGDPPFTREASIPTNEKIPAANAVGIFLTLGQISSLLFHK